jgi:glycosyltransferase involved in cell wall biosynthesis
MSVEPYVDEILLWDTGSTDGTVEIIKRLAKASPKVKTRFLSSITSEDFPKIRQQMLDETTGDWFLVVDGDEIWWSESVQKVVNKVHNKGQNLESIVVPSINMIGDMFHYLSEDSGHYNLAGKRGHLALRAVNRTIPGLHSHKPHGTWGWVDSNNNMIQDRSSSKILFVDAPYIHTTFLERSSSRQESIKVPKRAKKLKYEIGIEVSNDYFYPEVFFKPRPDIVPSVWCPMDFQYKLRAHIETPLKKLKRQILPEKVGY